MALKIALLGTRGIPANYGGFETFAEELSTRLVVRGHDVTVYGRNHYIEPGLKSYKGVRVRRLPAIKCKYLDTVSSTFLAVMDSLFRSYDIVLICNAANAFLSWVPRLGRQSVVLNVDGIERRRKKWNWVGKEFYRLSERLAVTFPNEIVTDAETIQRYYLDRYHRSSRFIPYGAEVGRLESTEILERLGIRDGQYLVFVSRLEPENNAHLVINAYLESGLELPLLIVGDAPYADEYISELRELAKSGNVIMPGAIYGRAYRELLSHSLCYLHGTEVGGSHPALIEAMGAGTLVLANDTPENREVLGNGGMTCSFEALDELAGLMKKAVNQRSSFEAVTSAAQERVTREYNWETVTDQYEDLFHDLTR
ncbi:MAG: glycosyltransferase [bacterium]